MSHHIFFNIMIETALLLEGGITIPGIRLILGLVFLAP